MTKSTKSIMDKDERDNPFNRCELCGQLKHSYMIIKGICVDCKEYLKGGQKRKELKIPKETLYKLGEVIKKKTDEEYMEEVFDNLREVYRDNGLDVPYEKYEVIVTETSIQNKSWLIKANSAPEAIMFLQELLNNNETGCPMNLWAPKYYHRIVGVERIENG